MQLQNLLKTATALSVMAFSLVSAGQTFYTFSKTQAVYNEITDGTLVTNTLTQNAYYVTLPVSLKLFDEGVGNILTVGKNGFIVATGPDYSFATDPFTISMSKIDNNSSLTWKMQPTANDTVIIIQWKNMRPDSAPDDVINMQCRIYKQSQAIEFHYGSTIGGNISSDKLEDSTLEILAGIFLLSKDFTQAYEYQRIKGDQFTPTITFDPNEVTSLIGFPSYGTIYRFTRKSAVGIKENKKPAFSLYPNPASDKINIELPKGEIENVKITTVTGQILYNGGYTQEGIDVSAFAPGIYTVTITNSDGETNTTLLKK